MKALAIGAGLEQIYSIRQAKDMGLTVVAVDGDKFAPGFQYADYYYHLDLSEVEKIIDLAKKHEVKMIIPAPIGRFITTIGSVNEALGLPGVTREAAGILSDKSLYYSLLENLGMFKPVQFKLEGEKRSLLGIKETVKKIGFPCILKPSKGSGSRGVVVLLDEKSNEQQICMHLDALMTDESSLVEAYIEGEEYGIDGCLTDNGFEIIAVRKKIMTILPYRQEVGYILESNKEILIKLQHNLSLIFTHLNINSCLIHADVIISNDRVFVVETSARPAGLGMMQTYIPLITGEKIIQKMIKYILYKESMNIKYVSDKEYGLFFFDFKGSGYLKAMPNENIVLQQEYVKFYKCNLKREEYIGIVRKGSDIFNRGNFIIEANSRADLLRFRDCIISEFEIREVENNEKL